MTIPKSAFPIELVCRRSALPQPKEAKPLPNPARIHTSVRARVCFVVQRLDALGGPSVTRIQSSNRVQIRKIPTSIARVLDDYQPVP